MYLGFDGGGSKTALILVDRDGAVRATHLTSGSYYPTLGLEALGTLIVASIQALLEKAGVRASEVDFAFLGVPGYGEDRVATAQIERMPQVCLRAGHFQCGNDMICGWAGSLVCSDGISVVAGTGSICYGERLGVAARCGGWGELFSDEGSAYWIACRGLDLFARMSDGRAAPGPLYHLIRSRLSLSDDLELCGHVYTTLGGDRARIAQSCQLVFEAAASGCSGSLGIIKQAAGELVLLVDTTRHRLGFAPDETVDVSYSGGVFEIAGAPLLGEVAAALRAHHEKYRFREPAFPPVMGAAVNAAKLHGRPFSPAAVERLRACKHDVQRTLRS